MSGVSRVCGCCLLRAALTDVLHREDGDRRVVVVVPASVDLEAVRERERGGASDEHMSSQRGQVGH